MRKLRECPFCGSDAMMDGDEFQVFCTHCDAVTDTYMSEYSAVDLWNTRHDDWISVKDRLPKDGTGVLISYSYNPDIKPYSEVAFLQSGLWHACRDRADFDPKAVTHWKPITLPKEK